MDTKNNKRRYGPPILAFLVAILLALAATPAEAHVNNQGTIKVHDSADADPDQRNEPHVDCDFWIEGFNMFDDSGELVIYDWPPTGNKSEVLRDVWIGTEEEDGDGHHFLNGPYTLPSGHYRVEAFSDGGHPGNDTHFAKAKMFWVKCGAEPVECPPIDITAVANDDGSITVSWDELGEGEMINLYRAEDGGDFVFISMFGEGTNGYFDTDTEVGVTYEYAVTSFDGTTESEVCDTVEVTAIPVFSTLLAGGLAAMLGIGAYVMIGRRR